MTGDLTTMGNGSGPSPLNDLALSSPLSDSSDETALSGVKCMQCGELMFGFRAACSACAASELEPQALARTGRVYSWTKFHVMPGKDAPVHVGYIDLDDGVRVFSEIRCDGSPGIDQAVEIQASNDGDWWFRPQQRGQA